MKGYGVSWSVSSFDVLIRTPHFDFRNSKILNWSIRSWKTDRETRATVQSFAILAILSFRWQKFNAVHLQSSCKITRLGLNIWSILNPTGVPLRWRDTVSLLLRPVMTYLARLPKATFFRPWVTLDDPHRLSGKIKRSIQPDSTFLKYFSAGAGFSKYGEP